MPEQFRQWDSKGRFISTKVQATSYIPEFRYRLFRTLSTNLDMAAAYLEADYKKSFPDGSGVHSQPGEIPRAQTGHLRRTITWDAPANLIRRVGSSLKPSGGHSSYAFYLEMGTGRMAARPWLNPGLDRNRKVLARFVGTPMR